jgi:hypothetical protein
VFLLHRQPLNTLLLLVVRAVGIQGAARVALVVTEPHQGLPLRLERRLR